MDGIYHTSNPIHLPTVSSKSRLQLDLMVCFSRQRRWWVVQFYYLFIFFSQHFFWDGYCCCRVQTASFWHWTAFTHQIMLFSRGRAINREPPPFHFRKANIIRCKCSYQGCSQFSLRLCWDENRNDKRTIKTFRQNYTRTWNLSYAAHCEGTSCWKCLSKKRTSSAMCTNLSTSTYYSTVPMDQGATNKVSR